MVSQARITLISIILLSFHLLIIFSPVFLYDEKYDDLILCSTLNTQTMPLRVVVFSGNVRKTLPDVLAP